MTIVYLHGDLGNEFGRHFEFEIESVSEAIQALRANFIEFANAIRHGFYHIVVGKTVEDGFELEEEFLPGFKLGTQDVHILPDTEGRKRGGGLGKIISGIALIGLSIASGGAAATGLLGQSLFGGMNAAQMIGTMGTGLLLNGVASLLAPEIKADDQQQSFTMSGPTSTLKEGSIVPIAYGEVVSGGYLITGGIRIRDKSDTSAPPTPSTTPIVGPWKSVLDGNSMVGGSLKEPAIPGGRTQ